MQVIANVLKAFIISLLILLVLFFAQHAAAQDGPITLEEVKIEYKNFFGGSHEPLINQNGLLDRELRKELSLNLNTTILEYGYWNNKVLSYTDWHLPSQSGETFRLVGWNFQLGIHLTDFLDIYYDHFSKHYLDHRSPNRFPVTDSVGINIYLYQSKNKKEGLF